MSESIIELSKSLSKFQGEVKQPKKDGTNPHFRSNFVTLDNVIASITDTASKFGLSFLQFPLNEEDKVGVKTIIMHESGEFIEGEPIFVKPQKTDAQALGAVVTYLRRYSLASIFGIASELDDDAEGAMVRTQQQKPQQMYTKPTQQKPINPIQKTLQMPKTLKDAESMIMPTLYTAHAGKTVKQVWEIDKSYLAKVAGHNEAPRELLEAILIIQQEHASKSIQNKTQG